jgi:predicted Fe-Mo cluster-binding NifX family protein
MKIAVITDDMKTISAHFGRAQYYLVFTVENGKIIAPESHPKPAIIILQARNRGMRTLSRMGLTQSLK